MSQNEDKKSSVKKLAKFSHHLSQLKMVLERLLIFSNRGIRVTNQNHSKNTGQFYNLALNEKHITLTEHFTTHTDTTILNVHNGEFTKNDEHIAAKHIVPFNNKIQGVIANLMESKAVLYRD